jgi:hypothetical protein
MIPDVLGLFQYLKLAEKHKYVMVFFFKKIDLAQ